MSSGARETVGVDFSVLSALGDYGEDFRMADEIAHDRRRNTGFPDYRNGSTPR